MNLIVLLIDKSLIAAIKQALDRHLIPTLNGMFDCVLVFVDTIHILFAFEFKLIQLITLKSWQFIVLEIFFTVWAGLTVFQPVFYASLAIEILTLLTWGWIINNILAHTADKWVFVCTETVRLWWFYTSNSMLGFCLKLFL